MVKLAATAAALSCLVGAGCSVKFDNGATRFLCTDNGPCPDGQTCVNDICLAAPPDAAPGDPDAPPLECQPTLHLVISEVNIQPERFEFIEIANPTDTVVSLDDVYLSDDLDYALTPGLTGNGPAPAPTSSDFIVKFPDGLSLEPGATITIAFDPDDFAAEFSITADLSIGGMVRIAPPAGTPSLNNSGESVVLFRWDGLSDLVTDIDAVVFGAPIPADDLADKSAVLVDGPDADTTASMYATDASTIIPVTISGNVGDSLQRVIGEAGREAAGGGGNGTNGEDETTETLMETWSSFSPTPGVLAFCIPE